MMKLLARSLVPMERAGTPPRSSPKFEKSAVRLQWRPAIFSLAVVLTGLPIAVFGQSPASQHNPPQLGSTMSPDSLKPLPDIKGVVSWQTLGQVESVKVKDRVVPKFSDTVLKLNDSEVKLQGFMLPLEMGDKQKHFVLSAMSPTCAFCLPGGPEMLVEVRAKTPVKYTVEPIILSGKLAVLQEDPNGLYYRLTEAAQAAPK
jgi:hypothetical protein